MNAFLELLQNREQFAKEIVDAVNLRDKHRSLAALSAVSFGFYGLIIGSQNGFRQAILSGIKLPILFMLTLVICMPTLFIFSSFFGSKQSVLQTLVVLLAGTSIMGIALVAFAPVTAFFILTTHNYQFFKLLNIFFFSVSGILGVLVFKRFHSQFPFANDQMRMTRGLFLRFWFLLYAFVGTQLAWTLRPFFGAPDMPFAIIRELGGNFYTDLFKSIGHILGAH
jgi:hypothetical protein